MEIFGGLPPQIDTRDKTKKYPFQIDTQIDMRKKISGTYKLWTKAKKPLLRSPYRNKKYTFSNQRQAAKTSPIF